MKFRRLLNLGVVAVFCVAVGVSQADARPGGHGGGGHQGGGGGYYGGGKHHGGRHHHKGGRGSYGWYPYYGYYAPYYADPYYYDDDCLRLYHRALRTGSSYWWRRYYRCVEY